MVDFHRNHARHVRAFAELLIVLRREFDSDLDLVLLLAVIAERHYARCEEETRPVVDEPDAAPNRYVINTHSVSLYAAIPRETVRRKIRTLVGRGWVMADEGGHLRPTARAEADLCAATEATSRYLATVASL